MSYDNWTFRTKQSIGSSYTGWLFLSIYYVIKFCLFFDNSYMWWLSTNVLATKDYLQLSGKLNTWSNYKIEGLGTMYYTYVILLYVSSLNSFILNKQLNLRIFLFSGTVIPGIGKILFVDCITWYNINMYKHKKQLTLAIVNCFAIVELNLRLT